MTPPVSGYMAWYDASDTASITVPGSNLASQWNDQTGTYNLTQATTGNRPLSGTRTLNGKNVLDFAPGHWMTNATLPVDTTMTCFAVCAFDTQQATIDSIVLGGFGGLVQMIVLQQTSQPSGGEAYCYAGGAAVAFTPSIPSLGVTYCITTKINSTASITRLDGSAGTSASIGTNTDTGITIGDSSSANTGPLDGPIAEIIIYDTVLSDPECTSNEQYLSAKWGSATPPGLLVVSLLHPTPQPNAYRM